MFNEIKESYKKLQVCFDTLKKYREESHSEGRQYLYDLAQLDLACLDLSYRVSLNSIDTADGLLEDKPMILSVEPEKVHEGTSKIMRYKGKKYTFMCTLIEDEESIRTNNMEDV